MQTSSVLYASPIGSISLISSAGALRKLSMEGQKGGEMAPNRGSCPVLDRARRQLDLYFAGKLTAFDLPLAEEGTPFQRQVWAMLRTIPYGKTTSYAWLASAIGAPRAVRAVGAANGRNPIGIITPCHRVIGANGSLTGYAGGLERKRALLQLEGALERGFV
jgi:methylated-DNA-[protein]-cysteine S-methyltransferase